MLFTLAWLILGQSTAYAVQKVDLVALSSPPVWAENGACVLFGSGADGRARAVRFDPSRKQFVNLPNPETFDTQLDCGQGLFAISLADGAHVFDISTGKDLHTFAAKPLTWKRVGGLMQLPGKGKQLDVYDARTGKSLGLVNFEFVWDSPARRLAMQSSYQKPMESPDRAYRLLEFKRDSLSPFRATEVGRVEREFLGFGGNPDSGPILLDFSYAGVGVENIYYEVVGPKGLSPLTLTGCWGGFGNYILASNDNGYPVPRGKDRYGDLICYTSDGKAVWRVKFSKGDFKSAEWSGDKVLVHKRDSDVLLDPANGKRIGVNKPSSPYRYSHGKWSLIFDSHSHTARVYKAN